MKLFKVFTFYGDTSGNYAAYEHGIYEAEDEQAVEAVFPAGFMTGWRIVEITPLVLPSTPQKPPREPGR